MISNLICRIWYPRDIADDSLHFINDENSGGQARITHSQFKLARSVPQVRCLNMGLEQPFTAQKTPFNPEFLPFHGIYFTFSLTRCYPFLCSRHDPIYPRPFRPVSPRSAALLPGVVGVGLQPRSFFVASVFSLISLECTVPKIMPVDPLE